jgi:hypothetical protein
VEKKYFITFIDDISRKCWMYFLKEKSEAFDIFKKYNVMVEKSMGYYVRALRSHIGGKYLSNKFKTYYEKQGVQRYLTTPYTPQ